MKHPFRRRRLGEVLVDRGAITPEQVQTALQVGEGRIGERLVRRGWISQEQLAQALAEQFRLPYVEVNGQRVPPELFELLPATDAYRYAVLPLARAGGRLDLVIADPLDLALQDWLRRVTGLDLNLRVGSRSGILAALQRSGAESSVLREVAQDFRVLMVKEDAQGREQTVSLESVGQDSSPVVTLANTILLAALQKRASDIHIETYKHGLQVKYRVDGVLYPATEALDARHQSALVSRLKVMAELDIAEKRVPQDGRFRLRVGSRDVDFRLSILPSVYGEDVVIRILDKSAITDGLQGLRLDKLGLAPDVLKKLRKCVREPYGMVLITGPTGSGKTTTLYAALSELDAREEKIITIEDPVEYQLDGIVQIPVNEKKNLSFARGLRSILRHDPDKIMVGEIRDTETATIAVQSALTGHLVFTTVHANNAFDVLGRFSHMGVEVYSFVSALNCVMAQRLVRLICPHCRQPVQPDAKLLEFSGLDPRQYGSHPFYEGAGCEQCNGTGYRGRAAIAEFLDLSPRIRQMMIERRPLDELHAVAREDGMLSLRAAALNKAVAGETTLKEINRVTFVD